MSGAFVKRYDKNLATKLRALRELTHPSISGDRRPSGMRVSNALRRGGEASPAVWSRGTHRSLRSHRLHVRSESKSVPHPARLRSVSGRLAVRTASQWRLAGVAGSETIATCAPSAAAPGLSGTPPGRTWRGSTPKMTARIHRLKKGIGARFRIGIPRFPDPRRACSPTPAPIQSHTESVREGVVR